MYCHCNTPCACVRVHVCVPVLHARSLEGSVACIFCVFCSDIGVTLERNMPCPHGAVLLFPLTFLISPRHVWH